MQIVMGSLSTWLFIGVTILGLLVFMYVMHYRIQIMKLGSPDDRTDHLPHRVWMTIKYAFLQYKMPQEIIPGILHIMIFFGFLTLGVRTVILFGHGIAGADFSIYSIPQMGYYLGPLYAIAKELVVIAVLIGVAGFAWRRMISKPARMQNIPVLEPVVILAWISGLMFADMLAEGGLHAAGFHEEGFITVPSLGWIFAPLFNENSGPLVWEIFVWVHSVMILVFLNYLPFGKHFHIITAIPNVFLGRLEPKGHLRPITDIEDKFEQMEEDESIHIGYQNVEHYTWKEIIDLYSCTECGRCQPQCPAFATDKPLSLKQVNKDSKHHLLERAPYLLEKKIGPDGVIAEYEGEETVGNIITAETLWACTLCGDCEERCPVLIEQIPRIVDMRRHLAMMEGDVPTELNNTFRGWERNSNPWGLGYDSRADWITEDVDVKLLSDDSEVDYLLYVGCMGSFDDRSTRVTKSLVKILNAAGISFGVLGTEEQCCGETARRLGNEFLGQMIVMANIEIMQGYDVKKVITFCPHCFNTLKNEYQDFGMKFEEVWHASDFVLSLVAEGRISVNKGESGEIAYHDSCMLGRYNGIFEQPRNLIEEAGASVKESSLNHNLSFCCGAGGGKMWMEEEQPRVNDKRFGEIWESCNSPKTIGVSCPYCLTMLLDGSKNANKEDEVKVRDVIEIIADNLEI